MVQTLLAWTQTMTVHVHESPLLQQVLKMAVEHRMEVWPPRAHHHARLLRRQTATASSDAQPSSSNSSSSSSADQPPVKFPRAQSQTAPQFTARRAQAPQPTAQRAQSHAEVQPAACSSERDRSRTPRGHVTSPANPAQQPNYATAFHLYYRQKPSPHTERYHFTNLTPKHTRPTQLTHRQ